MRKWVKLQQDIVSWRAAGQAGLTRVHEVGGAQYAKAHVSISVPFEA